MSCFATLIHALLAIINLAFLIIDIVYISRLSTTIILAISILLIICILLFLSYHTILFVYSFSDPKFGLVTVLRMVIIPIFLFTLSTGISSMILAANMKTLGNYQFFLIIGGFYLTQAIFSIPEIIALMIQEFAKIKQVTAYPKSSVKRIDQRIIYYSDL